VAEAVSFQTLADTYDMFPSTLHEINGGSRGGLTENGLRSCTATATFDEEKIVVVEEDSEQPGAATGGIRTGGHMGRGAAKSRKVVRGVCEGPSAKVLEQLKGWEQGHADNCSCPACTVPAGTVVRVIPRHGDEDWRESSWLREHWKTHSQKRFPFCALHCLMRVTEAMFMMITQRCLKKEPVIDRLNQGLKDAGICKQFSKVAGVSGMHTYEKLTFEGHQAMKLLAVKDGKMAVELILESMWPTGDSECEGTVQKAYVPRQAALWRQWSKVVELMTQRDPVKVRANVDLGRNGFERFGKECREFCRMYQAMFHEQHCSSFYLHTLLLHHAGDFMRELEKDSMCLNDEQQRGRAPPRVRAARRQKGAGGGLLAGQGSQAG
jgi:hypothetical protein